MRTTIKKSGVVLAVVASVFSACQSSVPNQVLTKPAPSNEPAPAALRPALWPYRPSTQRQSFVIDQRAVLVIRTDTIARTDSLSSHSELAFAATAGGSVSGNVSAFAVRANVQNSVAPAGLALPFPFRGDFSTRGTQLEFLTPRDAAPCASNPLSIVQSLRDLWFRTPDTLRVGSAWSDSASYVICRDGIPLRASVQRSFRVTRATERDGRLVLDVVRTARTSLEGAGTQFGETVTISGTGGGELTYQLDPAAGEIVSASGNAVLDFSLRGRLRSQAVHQTAEIRIGRS